MSAINPAIRPAISAAIRGGFELSGGSWSPTSLFAASEVGAWYDPSDLSTMFQENYGLTPVTADGQQVGLILDKSKSLALGSELFPGSYTSLGSGWSFSSGTLTATAGSNGNSAISSTVTTNTRYLVSFTVVVTSGTLNFSVSGATDVPITASGSYTFRYGGVSTSDLKFTSSSFIGTVAGLSIKKLFGHHSRTTTTSKAPIYRTSGGRSWLEFDGVDDASAAASSTLDLSGTDEISIFYGATASSATNQTVFEFGAWLSNTGSFQSSYQELGYGWTFSARGSAATSASQRAYTPNTGAADTAVISAQSKIAADMTTIRRNGVAGTSGTADMGTGNFSNLQSYLCARSGSSNYMTGKIFGMIVRGKLSTAAEISAAEAWLNSKTGAY